MRIKLWIVMFWVFLVSPIMADPKIPPPTVNGLLQVWAVGGDSQRETFFVKRAELAISGDVVKDKLSYAYMVDLARALGADETSSQFKRILQDVILTYHVNSDLSADIGQFKVPISMEGLAGSGDLDFAERAMIARIYGDQRDLGFQVRGMQENIGYTVAVFNGEGQNVTTDTNNRKDFAGRITVNSSSGNIHLGASGYTGRLGPSLLTKDRFGAEFRIGSSSLFKTNDRVFFSSEYISAKDGPTASNGYYGTIGYKLDSDWQLAVRYDQLDPNTSVTGDLMKEISVGLNFYLKENNAKLQFNYVFSDDESTTQSSSLIAAIQMAY